MSAGIDYLFGRNFTEETLREFSAMYFKDNQLSVIPDSLHGDFIMHVKSLLQPVPPDTISKFDDCVLFPVLDLYNKFITIFARRLNGAPKFDALPYDKKSIVYGLNKSYDYILNRNNVFVVEGIFDCMMLWQYGIRNVVTPLGCSLSYEQMCLLARFTNTFTVIFDPDQAGRDGMLKAKLMLTKHGYKCNTVFVPEGLDVDDYVVKYGIERFLQNAKNSSTLQKYTVGGGIY